MCNRRYSISILNLGGIGLVVIVIFKIKLFLGKSAALGGVQRSLVKHVNSKAFN